MAAPSTGATKRESMEAFDLALSGSVVSRKEFCPCAPANRTMLANIASPTIHVIHSLLRKPVNVLLLESNPEDYHRALQTL
jgi:hypothetical protein